MYTAETVNAIASQELLIHVKRRIAEKLLTGRRGNDKKASRKERRKKRDERDNLTY